MLDQLRKFRYHLLEPKGAHGDPTKRPKMVLTGKGAGGNDDMCICVMMLAFWPPSYMADGDAALVSN